MATTLTQPGKRPNIPVWVVTLLLRSAFQFCVAVLVSVWPSRSPLDAKVTNIEPASVQDETGKELSLVTLSISNNTRTAIYFAREWLMVESKVVNQRDAVSAFTPAQAKLAALENRAYIGMIPQQGSKEVQVVVLSDASACRLHFRYAPESLAYRLVQHLARLHVRMPPKLWRSVYPPAGQNPHWREKVLDVALH